MNCLAATIFGSVLAYLWIGAVVASRRSGPIMPAALGWPVVVYTDLILWMHRRRKAKLPKAMAKETTDVR